VLPAARDRPHGESKRRALDRSGGDDADHPARDAAAKSVVAAGTVPRFERHLRQARVCRGEKAEGASGRDCRRGDRCDGEARGAAGRPASGDVI